MGKVIRLEQEDTGTDIILRDLLEASEKNQLRGLVIIASLKEQEDTNENKIHRWFFDMDRRCVDVLGLIEYMKAYILDYIREAGEL